MRLTFTAALAIIASSALIGCVDQNNRFTQFHTTGTDAWTELSPVEFTPDSAYTAANDCKHLNMDIMLRCSTRNMPDTARIVVLREAYIDSPECDTIILVSNTGDPGGLTGKYGVNTLCHTINGVKCTPGMRISVYPESGYKYRGIQAVGVSLY